LKAPEKGAFLVGDLVGNLLGKMLGYFPEFWERLLNFAKQEKPANPCKY
jgi:hypothetical protein